jgi:hypothetical protein
LLINIKIFIIFFQNLIFESFIMSNIVEKTMIGSVVGGGLGTIVTALVPAASIITVPLGVILGGGVVGCSSILNSASSATAKVLSSLGLVITGLLGNHLARSNLNDYREAGCSLPTADLVCWTNLAVGITYSYLTMQIFNLLQKKITSATEKAFPEPTLKIEDCFEKKPKFLFSEFVSESREVKKSEESAFVNATVKIASVGVLTIGGLAMFGGAPVVGGAALILGASTVVLKHIK